MHGIEFLIFLVAVLLIGGPILAGVALAKANRLAAELTAIRAHLKLIQHELRGEKGPLPSGDKMELALEPESPPVSITTPQVMTPAEPPPVAIPPQGPPSSPRHAPAAEEKIPLTPPETTSLSLEMKLGTRWLNWVGIVMLLVGIAFFLKYAYDNAWIGPGGRLAIGTVFGVVALAMGERFRRRDWAILFQVFTGGGLAAFYLCVFFSFQVYRLTDQTFAMFLAIIVTTLAVVMAVAHHAVSIALLSLIGGFLSPILLSTGENAPYALFTYIAILDLVAMGAAYFRRWRALDLFCFIGTTLIFLGWHGKFYGPSQMAPALLFTSLFTLMFLLIPTLYSLVRRLPETPEGLSLVVSTAVLSFFSYYTLLFPRYRYALGFVVLGQALLVFLLFQIWIRRVRNETNTSSLFLTLSLGLVLIAIPIQLRFYGVPIAWSMEGAVLIILGIRFRQLIPQVAGVLALVLAVLRLIMRLPLHQAVFSPVFNLPFGSWSFVIIMASLSAFLLARNAKGEKNGKELLTWTTVVLALGSASFLLSMEVSLFWRLNHPVTHYRSYEWSSLAILWSLIPAAMTFILARRAMKQTLPLSWIWFGIGMLLLLLGFEHYDTRSSWLGWNASFAPRLIFILSLWWAGTLHRQIGVKVPADIYATAGHGLLAVLMALEFSRWSHSGSIVSPTMAISLISAAWAIQAFIVIWIGLAKRSPLLRYLGFSLFVLTIGKTLFIDMSELEKVYRIISFVASGLLLVAAGYFYQRYSAKISEHPHSEKPQ